jgi:hypothetical protein
MKKNLIKLSLATLFLVGIFAASTSCKKDDKTVNVSTIALSDTAVTLGVGDTKSLAYTFSPSDVSNKDLTWKSGTPAVASVDVNGVVTAANVGSTIITATSKADTTKTTTCKVTVIPAAGTIITVSEPITTDTKWYANARYKLASFVYVRSGATLTIEPGTIIQGALQSKGALIIERGAKIIAQGTAAKPIIFTSSVAKGSRAPGDWGGLVLCGKAYTNKHDNGTGVGIAEGGISSNYGGTDDNDNSGILQYVRIEYAGISLTSVANSEINGLTLYAVGKATTIDHIQVSYSGDDSYEWFGGDVNAKYLVAFGGVDDDFDTDNGFTGNLQFLLGIRNPLYSDNVSLSNGFESDNDADGSLLTPTTKPLFSNVTVIGPLGVNATLPATNYFQRAMHIRRSSQLSVYNSVFVGFPQGLALDGALGNTPTKAESNDLQIENCILAAMTTNFVSTAGSVPYTATQVQTYFEAASRNNKDDATVANTIGSLINLTSPTLLPATGSILLSGASFTNTRLSGNSFFTAVTYRGAFGTDNWTSGWCNFDPQNTDY